MQNHHSHTLHTNNILAVHPLAFPAFHTIIAATFFHSPFIIQQLFPFINPYIPSPRNHSATCTHNHSTNQAVHNLPIPATQQVLSRALPLAFPTFPLHYCSHHSLFNPHAFIIIHPSFNSHANTFTISHIFPFKVVHPPLQFQLSTNQPSCHSTCIPSLIIPS